jgi:hypothetical protein
MTTPATPTPATGATRTPGTITPPPRLVLVCPTANYADRSRKSLPIRQTDLNQTGPLPVDCDHCRRRLNKTTTAARRLASRKWHSSILRTIHCEDRLPPRRRHDGARFRTLASVPGTLDGGASAR